MALKLDAEGISKVAQGLIPGKCGYLHDGLCVNYWLKGGLHAFKFGLKFYFPLHFIPLLFRFRQVLKKPLETLRAALKGCVRSSLVLAGMIFVSRIGVCTYLKLVKSMKQEIMTTVAPLVTIATFIETPARISEMAIYVMPRFFDAVWKFLLRRNIIANIPNGQVMLFCMSLSAIIYSNYREPQNLKPTYRAICDKFFGEN